jgi:putative ABC transport system permease protein
MDSSGPTPSKAAVSLADSLTEGDYYALRQRLSEVSAGTPRVYVPAIEASANGKSVIAFADGLNAEAFPFLARRILTGSWFGTSDVARELPVCLITRSLAQELFGTDQIVGNSIRILGTPFIVAGVLSNNPLQANPLQPDAKEFRVVMPYTTLLARLSTEQQMSILLQVSSPEYASLVERKALDALEERRGARRAEFRTTSAVDSIRSYVDGSATMARFLAAVAAVALLAGGVGIMNVMLVSIAERTREIGIELAIGARPAYIQKCFIIETTAITLVGGGLGVLAGSLATWILGSMNEWPVKVTLTTIVGALSCSVLVGITFGFYPARQASKFRPIDALRSE